MDMDRRRVCHRASCCDYLGAYSPAGEFSVHVRNVRLHVVGNAVRAPLRHGTACGPWGAKPVDFRTDRRGLAESQLASLTPRTSNGAMGLSSAAPEGYAATARLFALGLSEDVEGPTAYGRACRE